MKLLWLCNSIPGVIRSHRTGKPAGAVNWVDHVLEGLRQQGHELRILCRGSEAVGILDDKCSYRCFGEETAHEYHQDLEALFRVELRSFKPDVIHSWGVEFSHTLAMVNAAEAEGMQAKMVASIQGLCAVLSEHYTDGMPEKTVQGSTLRDFLKKDNIAAQKEKFRLRGLLEQETVRKLKHVMGRTSWDRHYTTLWNPEVTYHFCNETLREPFYEGCWAYENCRKYRIFAPGCSYPIKGFHLLLEAFAEVVKAYPDATLAVTGGSFFAEGLKVKLRQGSYERYLAALTERYGLADRIQFLGKLSADGMKQAYLDANAFVMPSTMENSPNVLGESMLLKVPAIAADVGGVRDLMTEGEGIIYPSLDTKQLAEQIKAVFAMEEKAADMGIKASAHARITHDPQKNLQDLIAIYEEIM